MRPGESFTNCISGLVVESIVAIDVPLFDSRLMHLAMRCKSGEANYGVLCGKK